MSWSAVDIAAIVCWQGGQSSSSPLSPFSAAAAMVTLGLFLPGDLLSLDLGGLLLGLCLPLELDLGLLSLDLSLFLLLSANCSLVMSPLLTAVK